MIGVGLLALALWQLGEAIWGRKSHGGALRRVAHVAEALAFGFLGVSAIRVASGSNGAGSNEQQAGFTAKVLDAPGGQLLVAAAGLAVIGAAIYLFVKGYKRRFLRDLDLAAASPGTRKVTTRLGQVGYIALGIAYGIVGVADRRRRDPARPGEGDRPGHRTRHAGRPAVRDRDAAGDRVRLACFGVYCFLDARFRKRWAGRSGPLEPSRPDQLGDLRGVQRGALAQVVAAHEEVERVREVERLPEPAHVGRVGADHVGRASADPGRRVVQHHHRRLRRRAPRAPRRRSTGPAKRACTASEWVVTTGTRTQVADTLRSGMPRILRDSLRTFSSSDDQPPSRSEPAQGTTLSASGAGNGDSAGSPDSALRTSPASTPSVRSPPTAASSSYSRSMPAWPAPEAAWYDATTSSRSPQRRCSAPIAAIIVSVVQLGLDDDAPAAGPGRRPR